MTNELKLKSIVIGYDYFMRLKRLDENVKQLLTLHKNGDCKCSTDYEHRKLIALLESLDK